MLLPLSWWWDYIQMKSEKCCCQHAENYPVIFCMFKRSKCSILNSRIRPEGSDQKDTKQVNLKQHAEDSQHKLLICMNESGGVGTHRQHEQLANLLAVGPRLCFALQMRSVWAEKPSRACPGSVNQIYLWNCQCNSFSLYRRWRSSSASLPAAFVFDDFMRVSQFVIGGRKHSNQVQSVWCGSYESWWWMSC